MTVAAVRHLLFKSPLTARGLCDVNMSSFGYISSDEWELASVTCNLNSSQCASVHDNIYTVARLFETIYDPFRQHVKEDFFYCPAT